MHAEQEHAKEIALFPIPACVAFPGTIFPLHVFEPRYRSMVKHCIENDMLMGISHTQKIVSPRKEEQSLKEALQSNQATYKPYPIFSAGKCELVETLKDGRLRVNVQLLNRYVLDEEIQTLPFSICRCNPLVDRAMSDEERRGAEIAKQKILKRLVAITSDIPEVQKLLLSETWQNKDAEDFSFQLFGFLRLEPDMLQEILELLSTSERLEKILYVLNNTSE